MFLQKNTVEVPHPPQILLTDESYIFLNPISHNYVAQNSALIWLWLLAHHFCFAGGFSQALNLTLSWEGGQLVSKLQLASAPPSSRSWYAASADSQASPTQGLGSGRAVPVAGLNHYPRHNYLGTPPDASISFFFLPTHLLPDSRKLPA